MIKLGSNSIGTVYLGTNKIGKAYLGSNLVFQSGSSPTPPGPEPPTPSPSLIYSLESSVATSNYDTGVKLFNESKSFTIFCVATFNNYGWDSWTQGVFGIDTGNTFRFGSIQSGKDYQNDSLYTTANRYSAVIMNNNSEKRCTSLFARNNVSSTYRFVVRYNNTTRKIEGFNGNYMPTISWWTVPGDMGGITENTLKIWVGDASGVVNQLDIYDGVVEDQMITDFFE